MASDQCSHPEWRWPNQPARGQSVCRQCGATYQPGGWIANASDRELYRNRLFWELVSLWVAVTDGSIKALTATNLLLSELSAYLDVPIIEVKRLWLEKRREGKTRERVIDEMIDCEDQYADW